LKIEYYLHCGEHIVTVLLMIIGLSVCAGPIGVTRVSPRSSYKLSTDNVLGEGKMSDSTKAVLRQLNVIELFNKISMEAIRSLSEISKTDDRRDLLFALSGCGHHGVLGTSKIALSGRKSPVAEFER